jgi:hypothetical protein
MFAFINRVAEIDAVKRRFSTVPQMDFDRRQQRVSPTMARRRISSCPGLDGAL